MIIDPSGNIIKQSNSNKEEILICDIDFRKVENTRQHWPFLRDRRIDYYKGLLKNPEDAYTESAKMLVESILRAGRAEGKNPLQQLKEILTINDVDLIWIPRVNTVDGYTQEDVQKWGWRVTENNWINYPDYQARVFRNHKDIRWTRPLHEYITGCKTYAHLPPQEELSLYHPKTKEKQEQQNKFYNQNFSRELNVRR